MASTDFIARPYAAVSRERAFGRLAFTLIFSTIAFNAALSFLNAHITPVTARTVMVSEMLILGATITACYRSLKIIHLCLILATIFYTLVLSMFRSNISVMGGLDVKIVRDFLIPIVFFVFGLRATDLKVVDSVVFKITVLIFAVALFEYFFLDTYLHFFDVMQYYIARGTVEQSPWATSVAGGLMVNGMRPDIQGRVLLPFLGDHRVSSLFLEPIGLGNFGCIVALWGVIRSKMERKLFGLTILLGSALIILSDTRFDASFLVFGAILMLLPLNITTPAAMAAPFFAIAMLIVVGLTGEETDDITGLGLYPRLLYSGHVLLDFDVLNWLGVKVSRLEIMDAGYAYIISTAGVLGLALFWWVLMSLRGNNSHFYAFRNANAAYFATLLCVSVSQLTIKTAALQWFLMGALSVARLNGARPVARLPTDQLQPD